MATQHFHVDAAEELQIQYIKIWTCRVTELCSSYSFYMSGTTTHLIIQVQNVEINHQWNPLFKHSINHQLLSISPSVNSLILSITTANAIVLITVQLGNPTQQ